MTVQVWDETIPGGRTPAGTLTLDAGRVTVRGLLRSRVFQEVERYNRSLGDTFQGLVQPEESERTLNGFRMKARRPLDAEAQCRRACASFEQNGFLVLIDGEQVTALDAAVELAADSEVEFVKLVPLIGG